jgi:hypothetical protein
MYHCFGPRPAEDKAGKLEIKAHQTVIKRGKEHESIPG